MNGCTAAKCIYWTCVIAMVDLILCQQGKEVHVGKKVIRQWAQTLGQELISISREHMHLDNITKIYKNENKGKPADIKNNKNYITDNVRNDIENLLKDKRMAVLNLTREAQRIYNNYTYNQHLDVEYLNSKQLLSQSDVTVINVTHNEKVVEMARRTRSIDLEPDSRLNFVPVSERYSTVHVPTNVYDRFPEIVNGAMWSKQLDQTFRSNRQRDPSLKWQYFCSMDGFFRVFPGLKWPRRNQNKSESDIDLYDCRVRNWYLSAATCPKNIVILLDSSGSMKGQRMTIARATVKAILNTLDDDDYVNILSFSDKVHYVDECYSNRSMMPANAINKKRLQERIDDNVNTSKKADFKLAFEEAFDLFHVEYHNRKAPFLCNKAILLITDGVPEHYADVFNNHNWKYWPKNQTRVFTFLIGREVGDVREIRWIACANKGFYSHISTLANVQENVQNYINVLSRPMAIMNKPNQIWTSVYLDHMTTLDKNEGLQLMTSFAATVFDTKPESQAADRKLLGVVGTDVPISSLQDLAPSYKIGMNSFAFILNHNGYVLMHPNYSPYRWNSKQGKYVLNPFYQNVNFTEVVHPINAQNQGKLNEMLAHMIGGSQTGSMSLFMMSHYDQMKRMVIRQFDVCYEKISKTNLSADTLSKRTDGRDRILVRNGSPLLIVLTHGVTQKPYCKGFDTTLEGPDRKKQLLRAFEKQNKCEEKLEVVTAMMYDCLNINDSGFLRKQRLPRRHLENKGVELIFFSTVNGLTAYQTPSGNVSEFVLNNTDPLASEYFKRAVDGLESNIVQEHYNFIFSLDIQQPFVYNTTLVTVTAPVISSGVVHGVSGMQMTYEAFYAHFKDSLVGQTGRCMGEQCLSCQYSDKNITCNNYLVDNHGYIVASVSMDHVNAFFGDVENDVMHALVMDSVFKGYQFTDHQANCDIMDGFGKKESGASTLLNPLKAMARGLFWLLTEIVLFISEMPFSSATKPGDSGGMTEEQCKQFGEDYDFGSFSHTEKESFWQIDRKCKMLLNKKKVIGHKPCHKNFLLYHANFTRFINSKDVSGYVSRCREERSNRCKYPDEDYIDGHECALTLQDKYVVQKLEDTNLLLITTSNTCLQCPDYQPFDFMLDHRQVNYTETEECERRVNSYRHHKLPACHDQSDKEKNERCGSTCIQHSIFLLSACILLTKFTSVNV